MLLPRHQVNCHNFKGKIRQFLQSWANFSDYLYCNRSLECYFLEQQNSCFFLPIRNVVGNDLFGIYFFVYLDKIKFHANQSQLEGTNNI